MITAWASAASEPVVTVTDVKNYVYCGRVPFYTTFLPQRPTTVKMEAGREGHAHTVELEERRSLRAYRLKRGEREFRVRLFSERLGLSGLLDMAILLPDEVIAVEFKDMAGWLGLNHKYQLTAYGLLVEEHWNRPARRGFVYMIPQKKAHEVKITAEMRQAVLQVLVDLRKIIREELKPPPTRWRARCTDCEFRRYCPDIG